MGSRGDTTEADVQRAVQAHCGRAAAPRPWPWAYPRPYVAPYRSPHWQSSPNQCTSAVLGTLMH